MSEVIQLPISPAQRAVDWRKAQCCKPRFAGKWLWDFELDGGGDKNAKGESAVAKAHRHAAAIAVCHTCDERAVCLAAALADPLAEGIYGGELITDQTRESRPWTTSSKPSTSNRRA